ncbi:MAG: hypothetical protein U0169_01535 [Polyangiaceae bacterium]
MNSSRRLFASLAFVVGASGLAACVEGQTPDCTEPHSNCGPGVDGSILDDSDGGTTPEGGNTSDGSPTDASTSPFDVSTTPVDSSTPSDGSSTTDAGRDGAADAGPG